jgi:beta-lactamase class A
MPIDDQRRTFLRASLAGATVLALRPALAAPEPGTDALVARIAALEHRHGGRLGVAIIDTGNGRRVAHRGDERFPMCSTFKWLAVAAVLARVDRGEESLDRRIVFTPAEVVTYSPITESRTGEPGMSLAEVCQAALRLSDNTAGNLLLDRVGGPAGVTAFARSVGDQATRLDRRETMLNEATPGDPRDTTTPLAMAGAMQAVLLGDVLAAASRERLVTWMAASTTGTARLKAGLPAGWRVVDKTGTSNNGVSNDLAIAWPPSRAPLLVAAYYAESPLDGDAREAVLAEVGRLAANMVPGSV